MPTMFHSILPSKLPMGRMLLQCPNTSMKAPNKKATGAISCYSYLPLAKLVHASSLLLGKATIVGSKMVIP